MYSEILRSTGNYTDEDVRLFERAVQLRRVDKHALLLRKGEVAKSIYYLLNGSAYQYRPVKDAEHNIIDLHIENEWFLNYESLITQRPSEVCIETFADSDVLEISLEMVHYLTAKSTTFMQLNRVLEGAIARMQFFDQSMTPSQKYTSILHHRPRLVQAFPLKMISSYLKITPETLSRVRRQVANGDIS